MELLKDKIEYLNKKANEYWERSKKVGNQNSRYHAGYADALLLAAEELESILHEMEVK